ncbi:MAG: ATP-binding protein [Spirochaetes bacterium]|nr:ATP-binding protein [Spirochaetota bacterium]
MKNKIINFFKINKINFIKSFWFKIYVLILISMTILISFSLFIVYNSISNLYFELIKENLSNQANLIEKTISIYLSELSTNSSNKESYNDEITINEINKLIKYYSNITNYRYTIILKNGDVIADSNFDFKKMENHSNRIEVINALYGERTFLQKFSPTLNENMFYYSIPIFEPSFYQESNIINKPPIVGKIDTNYKIIGVLRISTFSKNINYFLNIIINKIIFFVIFILILEILVLFFFTKQTTKNLDILLKVAKNFNEGIQEDIFIKGNDEFAFLANFYNELFDKIRQLIKEKDLNNTFLSTIIENVEEIIFLIDNNDKIIYKNKNFDQISEIKEKIGKEYWKVINSPYLINIINLTKNEKKKYFENVIINDEVYFCISSYLENYDKIIIILRNLTDFQKFIQQKKDFVINASHELKTPLTSIKGFLETIEHTNNIEEIYSYIKIIKNNTERLINIVNDLSLLGKLENTYSISIEEIDIKELINLSCELFKKDIENKNLKLILELDLIKNNIIKTDRFKLEQVFINIISNSIKYTDKGYIKIFGEEEDNSIIICIEDTGIGIPEKYLERIFERFFVIDKSRSKKLAGTGLGLSIVKHITNLLNIKVKLISEENKGTKFFLHIPKEIKSNIE